MNPGIKKLIRRWAKTIHPDPKMESVCIFLYEKQNREGKLKLLEEARAALAN